jgi:hypothetical protein
MSSVTGTIGRRSSGGVEPVPLARLQAYVQRADRSGYYAPIIVADDEGRFSIEGLPRGRIQFFAIVPGYDQPCGSVVELDGSRATASVEIVSSRDPLPLLPRSPPSLYGEIFVIDSGNYVLVPGVRLQYESSLGLVAATTTSDQQGRYMFCRLPWLGLDRLENPNLFLTKPGYKAQPLYANGGGATDSRFDIEMKRLP